jgi:hypothetical protein
MMKWLKQQWRVFRQSRPGHRFRELYERRERTPHARLKKTIFFVLGPRHRRRHRHVPGAAHP